MEITSLHLINEAAFHIYLIVIVAIVIPLFTYFGLKKEIKLIEQFLAIFGVVFFIELMIFLIPYLISPFK